MLDSKNNDRDLFLNGINLSKIKNVHFIGIGGIGISAIARMMLHDGKIITGQDMQEGEVVSELVKLGVDIKIGQSYENIPLDTDLIVYTIAIDNYDPDLALKIKTQIEIPVRSYPEMLNIVSRDKFTIAVSGTHGKTTTTAMIAQILGGVGYDPTVIVGSLLIGDPNHSDDGQGKSNFISGKSKYLVVEACEYRRSFLNINPKILIITNIDSDHLDYYKDIEDIKNAFHEMAMKVPADGYVVCNPDDENISDVIKNINAKVINWNDYFNLNLKLKIPGIHNKKDAAAAIATSEIIGISKNDAEKNIGEFMGTWKRFEFKGTLSQGSLVYDDYAHHPTEIKASLEGFRELFPKNQGWKINVIFQPHLFSRTKLLLSDFATSFGDADEVILLPIYYAREIDDGSISSEILKNEINKNTNNSKSFKDFESAEQYLKESLSSMNEKNIIITMGAGEASKVGDFLLKL
ncbi:MAG: UDP-N-acetylmuramate--L-alanine ligase [Candidatus Pacebacteria bacterium]|nr:UDP-N-acetylmuramate--L-alanine ligase [Candidatus Paceibacterota bacterium]